MLMTKLSYRVMKTRKMMMMMTMMMMMMFKSPLVKSIHQQPHMGRLRPRPNVKLFMRQTRLRTELSS